MYDGYAIPDAIDYFHTLHNIPGVPDGAQMRYWILDPPSLAPLNTVWFIGGRGSFLEKTEKTYEELWDMRLRVIATELLNQGSSSRTLEHRDYIDDPNMHVRCAYDIWHNVVVPNTIGKLVTLNHSLGGHVKTRALAEYRNLDASISATAFLAPMHTFTITPLKKMAAEKLEKLHEGLDLGRFIEKEWMISKRIFGRGTDLNWRVDQQQWYTTVLTWLARSCGQGKEYALGEEDYNHDKIPLHLLSRNIAHFRRAREHLDRHPHKCVGGLPWDSVWSYRQSIRHTRQPGYLEKIASENVTITGGGDMLTPFDLTDRSVRRMRGRHILLGDALHDLVAEMEMEPYKSQGWGVIRDHFERCTAPSRYFVPRCTYNQPAQQPLTPAIAVTSRKSPAQIAHIGVGD